MDKTKALMALQIQAQQLQSPSLPSTTPIFYRNLEARLDTRRQSHRLLQLHTSSHTIDFSSNDFLSTASSGLLRTAFLAELANHPTFPVGSTGSRMMDGNTSYVEQLEREIADFHGADTGLLFPSGYDANVAIYSTIPLAGDVVVYDELVHASIHDGLGLTQAAEKRAFAHNDVDAFRETVAAVRDAHAAIREGRSTVLVAVESVYSMDGNVAPLREMVRVAREELSPRGNVQFVVDEAHSTGLVGEKGNGLVSIVLGNQTIRTNLVNYARGLIYTTAPGFPTLAAVRASYRLLIDGKTVELQSQLQQNLRYFHHSIQSHPLWPKATAAHILAIPAGKDYAQKPFLTQIVPIWTRARDNHHLAAHIHFGDMTAWPVDYPVVPKEQGRVRLVFHAGNDRQQIDRLVGVIMEWAGEMLEMNETGAFPTSLAYWLALANHQVTIVERSPHLRASGAQIDIREQGIPVLQRMHLLSTIRDQRVHEAGMAFLDPTGTVHGTILANTSGQGAQTLTSEYEIMRGDLVRTLYAATKDDVQYIFGVSVERFEQPQPEKNKKLTVFFSDGSSDDTFDLLVGADGQGSRIRQAILPADAPDPYRRLGVHVAYWEVPTTEGDSAVCDMCHFPGGRVVLRRTQNETRSHVYFAFKDDSQELSGGVLHRAPVEKQREFFARRFRGAGWLTERFLHALEMDSTAEEEEEEENFYCQEVVQVRVQQWVKGRVVLLGDAAQCPSPMTGMGTTNALVGAYVLAGEINRNPEDLEMALQEYQAKMRGFVRQIPVLNSGVLRFLMPQAGWGVTLFHFVIGWICWLRIPELVARYTPQESHRWKLPDYEYE
ncbi:synthase [Aspergillus nanangensis]|uniref:Synthase n=1 Tax=Aspergillus nanangensis TaxID=2582783 RepID=A0AAD4GTT3_ASPNN|nr:synthase [Aspergillus nanangensis]